MRNQMVKSESKIRKEFQVHFVQDFDKTHVKLFPNFTSIIIILHINIIGDNYANNHGFFAFTLYQINPEISHQD